MMIVAEIKNRTKIHKEVSVCSDGPGADTSGRCLFTRFILGSLDSV